MSKTLDRFLELAERHEALLHADDYLFRYSKTIMPPGESPIIVFQRQVNQEVAHEIMSSQEIGDLLSKLRREKLSRRAKKKYDEFSLAHDYAANEVPKPPKLSTWGRFYQIVQRNWALHSTNVDLRVYEDTYMPERERKAISRQQEIHSVMAEEIMKSEEMADLIKRLRGAKLNSTQRVIYREVAVEHRAAVKVPLGLYEKREIAVGDSYRHWLQAKRKNDFAIVSPALERVIDLEIELARRIEPNRGAYVALRRYKNRGRVDISVEDFQAWFRTIHEQVSPMIAAISALPETDDSILHSRRRIKKSRVVGYRRHLAELIGFDFNLGRIDETEHPYTSGSRHSTGKHEGLWETINSNFHEVGHARMDQHMPRKHYFDPLGTSRSNEIEESQSRLYENHVGLSRAFWKYEFPTLQEHFPEIFGHVEFDSFYRSINKVNPGFIRLQADELTYIIHVLLRVDLEMRLADGKLSVKNLPQTWNEGMVKYLGIKPPNDKLGALQDMHWYEDGIGGSFDIYGSGSVIGAQFFAAMERDIPEIAERIRRPQLVMIDEWLGEKIHRHGKRYSTKELVERATGKPPGPEDYINYLVKKFGALYNLPVRMNGRFYELQKAA